MSRQNFSKQNTPISQGVFGVHLFRVQILLECISLECAVVGVHPFRVHCNITLYPLSRRLKPALQSLSHLLIKNTPISQGVFGVHLFRVQISLECISLECAVVEISLYSSPSAVKSIIGYFSKTSFIQSALSFLIQLL